MEYKIGDLISSKLTGRWGDECDEADGGVPIFGISDMKKDGSVSFDDVSYRKIDVQKADNSYLKNHDILIAKSGNPKICFYEGEDDIFMSCNFILTLRANTDLVVSKYLYYAIKYLYSRGDIKKHYTSTTIPNLSVPSFLESVVKVADLDVQENIVAILDKVADSIKKRERQILALDSLIKSRFMEMFGSPEGNEKYPYVAIKDLTKVISGGTPNRKKSEYWDGGTIPWIKTTELKNCRLTKIDEHITQIGLEESSAKIIPKNTVLVAMYGQGKTRGMTAILDIPEATTNQACACLLPSEKIEAYYLWHYLILSYDRLRNLAQGGNQPNLNGNMIKNFTVLVPPRSQQISFVEFVKQVDKTKCSLEESLEKMKLLLDGLMQNYFG